MAEKLGRVNGIVSRVDRTLPGGWIKVIEGGKKEWAFLPSDLKGGLCISKIKKGQAVYFRPEDGPNPRARMIFPCNVFVVDKWGDAD